MKVGDLVRLKPDGFVVFDDPPQLGIIIEVDDFGESGLWYHVKWQDVDLWHVAGDIEVISESR